MISILGYILIIIAVLIIIILLFPLDKTKSWRAGKSVPFLLPILLGFGFVFVYGDGITKVDLKNLVFEKVTVGAIKDAKAIGALRTRVENQSATVDLVATQARAADQNAKDAEEQVGLAKEKIAELNRVISEAEEKLQEVNAQLQFTDLVARASNDDRQALDQLREIAEDPNNLNARRASAATAAIVASAMSTLRLGGKPPWSERVDPNKLSLWDYEIAIKDAASWVQLAVLEHMWNRPDFALTEKMDVVLKVMKNASSINTVIGAERMFLQGAKKDEAAFKSVEAFDIKSIEKWWEEHRQEYVQQP